MMRRDGTGSRALAGAAPQTASGTFDSSSPSEHFVESNGIRLHYLDWGGRGEPLLFLTGFGTPARTFDRLASTLRDRFRVYALTRRGLPPSDEPGSGYELPTLVADIVGFLDAQGLDRIHLVGHSLAGLEMTEIAGRWPDRVRSLVYLDAIADPATAYAVLQNDPLRTQPASGAVWSQISKWWNHYSVDFSKVKPPTLAMVAVLQRHPGVTPDTPAEIREHADAYWSTVAMPLKSRWLENFRREVPQAKVRSFAGASHYLYIDREADVLAEMSRFYADIR